MIARSRSLIGGAALAMAAAGMLSGGQRVVRRTDDEPEKEPRTDSAPGPRYVGMDLGREPGFTVTITARDHERLREAEAKRARKALKLPQEPSNA